MVQAPGGEEALAEEPHTDEPEQIGVSEQTLESMTKKQLIEYAKENGIEGIKQSMSKQDIFDIIAST